MRRVFEVGPDLLTARLYVTAHGVVDPYLNGQRVGADTLVPGWTSYGHRLAYRTYDVGADVTPGVNTFGAMLADGWYRGRLGYHENLRDAYGDDLSLIAQLELVYPDRTVTIATGDDGWEAATGPLLQSSLYDGELYDARIDAGWGDDAGWVPVVTGFRDPTTLFAPHSAPVRAHAELEPVSVTRRADGGILLDFGQNISGRLRLAVRGPAAGQELTLQHAEVLEGDELALRPLRTARATDVYIARGSAREDWEPRFTMHGFRYALVTGWTGPLDHLTVTAIAYATGMRRTGWFDTDHDLLNRFHENVRWGLLGNMVSLPTDCPQRDERLGWTADYQVFAPAASFLYDVSALSLDWMDDLASEQSPDGTVPIYVPWLPLDFDTSPAVAAWGDAAVLVPGTIADRFGDEAILAHYFEVGRRWVDRVHELAGPDLIWDQGFQFGDWLDPLAPPDRPHEALTSSPFVATASFAHVTGRLAAAAQRLGHASADAYAELAERVRRAFAERFLTREGLPVDDAQTACAIVLQWRLGAEHHRPRVAARLAELVAGNGFRIGTGFVGTPLVLDALADNGHLEDAYRLLLQTDCPSWLYAVEMGATTVWERWDSLLPDGSVNPGSMTSFNHYALGAVADWLHRRIGGLAPDAPGYRRIRFAPRPGGGITRAGARHLTPYGPASISWRVAGDRMSLELDVPTGATATLDLEGVDPRALGPGRHRVEVTLTSAEPRSLERSAAG
jgi:alpha-L-rhamnosidase